jgi:demethylmenaquinone methyltransferase/2-methoxy-6-polyprenyl-1,4-benzoquinol methylase
MPEKSNHETARGGPGHKTPRGGPGHKTPRSGGATTHFGYQEVPEAEKGARVRGVFESVAGRYDLMNDLMSGGVHRLWKAAMIDWLNPRPGQRLVDVAGGTGDIAFRVIERVGVARAGPIVICDLTPEMIAQGRDRAIDRGLLPGQAQDQEFGGLYWACADAERLPLPDRSMDAVTIAFGLRNVTRIERALAEARRVLRPGGRFLCLEFSRVAVPALSELYDLYSFSVLPALGGLVTGDREAYLYLAESIRRFPAQDALAGLMTAAGLDQVRYRNLSGGIAALHSGWRI